MASSDLVFEVHAGDGRTYTLKLNDADVAEVRRAAAGSLEGPNGAIAPGAAAGRQVAALFVAPRGPYTHVEAVEVWPESRDARTYSGPWPVVAHPPCARWTAYTFFARGGIKQHRAIGDDGGCFEAALAAVRTWGGVLEHPRYSRAWAAFGIQRPPRGGGWHRLVCGGWTCEVWQGRYGGRVPKPTWLYYASPAGVPPAPLDWAVATEREAMFSTFHRNDRRSGLTLMSKEQRSRTPDRFRDVLIALARGARTERGGGIGAFAEAGRADRGRAEPIRGDSGAVAPAS